MNEIGREIRQQPQRRLHLIIDIMLKLLLALPLLAWTSLALHEQLLNVLSQPSEMIGLLIVVGSIGYCLWSAREVWKGRKLAENTGIWAFAVAIMYLVAIPGFLELYGRSLERPRPAAPSARKRAP